MKIPPFLFTLLLVSCAGKKASDAPAQPQNTIVAAASTEKLSDSALIKTSPEIAFKTPGIEHKMLTSWNGKWVGEISFHAAPEQPVVKGASNIINKMVLGNRYLVSNQKGSIGNDPFEGISTLAFDNQKQQFVCTWVDNMGTGITMLQGPWNETTKTINLTGVESDPKSGKEKNIHETLRVIDNDRQVMEIFETGSDGKEFKTMEVLYTRKSR